MESLVIRTQLIPPAIKKNILFRKRLIKLLHYNLDKRLILLIGRAGYGKTTLISQFINDIKCRSVFYTINKDTDLSTFLSYLIAGIKNLNKDFGKRTMGILEETEPFNINLEILMGTFVNELLDAVKEELFIILDDYHLIDSVEEINKAVVYLLKSMPPNIHLIISSRREVPFSTNWLLMKNELLKITTEELKFTFEELQMLFKDIYKLNISPSILTKVNQYSEGWITVIQLIFHVLEKMGPKVIEKIRDNKEILNYFQEEVFELQTKDIQSFLIKSCILEQMSPVACDTVLKRTDSYKILSLLVKDNLFIDCINVQAKLFSYHPVFRDFLLKKLSQIGTDQIHSLHLRAGNYFSSIKNYTTSIMHYFSAQAIDKALKIIEKEGAKLIEARKFGVLEKWFKGVPQNIVQTNSTLLWYQAEILRWQGKWDSAMSIYKKLRRNYIKQGKKKELATIIYRIVGILRYRGHYKEAIKLGNTVLKTIGKKENLFKVKLLTEISSGYFYLSNYPKAISLISEALNLSQKLKKPKPHELLINMMASYTATDQYNRVIQIGEEFIKQEKDTFHYHSGYIYHNLAWAYMIRGDTRRARTLFKTALRIHKMFNVKRGINITFVALGELNLITGNYELSRLYCRKAIKLNVEMKESVINQEALEIIAKSYLHEGKIITAEEHINKLFQHGEKVQGLYLITSGEIQLELGNLKEAEKCFNSAFQYLKKSQSKFQLMLAHIALAKLYYKKNVEKPLQKHLRSAIEISKKYGYQFVLLKWGRIDFSLLQIAKRNRIMPLYVETLLKQLEGEYDLRITLFGKLVIKRKDGQIEEKKWERQKAKSLFCYMLESRGKKFTTDQLIELLWPGSSFSKKRSSFYRLIFCIRKYIDIKKGIPFIEYKDGTYTINPAYKIWIDTEEFESLIKEAEQWEARGNTSISINKYEIAIGLYQGDFLPEIYESWSEGKRRFYEKQYLQACNKVAIFYMKKQNFEKVIEYCTKIITIDEFRERAYFLAIYSYIKLKMPKSALQLYNKLRKALRELDIEPSLEIKKLINSIKN